MDSTGPVSVSNHKSSERKFFQWAVKWFYTDKTQDIIIKPDAPEMACLLQAIGFQLKEFDKFEDSKTKNESLKVIIECGSSKMRAVMELDDVACQCPSQDVSFWSVSGTGPLGSSMENINKVVETGSNLLPTISKGDANVIRDVSQHLLKLIKNIPDVNQNTDSNLNLTESEVLKISPNNQDVPFVRRHTQPNFSTERCRSLDTLTKAEDLYKPSTSRLPSMGLSGARSRSSNESLCDPQKPSWNKLSLMKEMENADSSMSTPGASTSLPAPLRRQKTFDMDIETSSIEGEPRPSPPKLSSSPVPVPQLCTSLGQISLQSEGKDASLVEMLFKAKLNLEQALKMLANSPHTSYLISEDMFLKPAPPRNNSFRISPGTNSRPESSCSLPVNSVSRTSSGQKSSVRRNVATLFRKSDGSTKSPVERKLAPPARTLLQRRSLGTRLPAPKPLGIKIDTPRPGTSGSSLSASGSRMIVAAKRRVSPDPKSSPGQKSSTSINTSGSQKASMTLHNKSQSGSGTPKTVTGASANKFGFTKKKP